MRCPQCQAENPAEAKFCLECGTKLQAACPQCGATLPPQSKFCFECGFKIAPPPRLRRPRRSHHLSRPGTGRGVETAVAH